MGTRMDRRSAARQGYPGRSDVQVERGPGWLFVQIGDANNGLAESVWETIREHGASRVVLELDRVERVNEALGDVIAELDARIREAGGLIRICGLSPTELSRLRRVEAASGVPHFDDRFEAVGARRGEAGSCE
jgi:hypothetical protein